MKKRYSVNGDAAEVNGDVLTAVKAGTVTVTATKAGDTTYKEAVSEAVTITVTEKSEPEPGTNGTLMNGDTLKTDKGTFTAKDGNATIVKDSDGAVTLKTGKLDVTGKDANTAGTVKAEIGGKTVDVTVPAGKTYTVDAGDKTVGTLAKGDTVTIDGITYTAGAGNATFRWITPRAS